MTFKNLKEIVKTIEEEYKDYDVDNFKIILNEDDEMTEDYDIDCGVNAYENYIRFTSDFV